ncbi:MAG: hypothetical protein JOY78_07475 [Pseudonocardia sp.]|nr:hypothetical protein [Pseudonocardia sp.]
MPIFLGNLPVHPLVVHAVVVLVPLAILGGLIVVVWPAARRRYGWLVVAVAAVATVAIPIATSTGEGLEHRLARTAAIEIHARLGDDLLIFVAGLLVALAAFVYLHHRATTSRARHEGPGTTTAPARLTGAARVAAAVLAVLVTVLAVISAVQVYRIGDSGAQAAWGDRQYLAPSGRP